MYKRKWCNEFFNSPFTRGSCWPFPPLGGPTLWLPSRVISATHLCVGLIWQINQTLSRESSLMERAPLGPVYTKRQRQCFHKSAMTLVILLIENNGVAWKRVATPIWSNSIVFNENNIVSIITELLQRWRRRLV